MPDQVDSNLAMVMFGEGRNILTSHLLGAGVDWPGSCDVLSTFPMYHHSPSCLGYICGQIAVTHGTSM